MILRTPPHSLESEQAVLGSILINNNLLDDVLDIIDKEDFYTPGHRDVFEALKNLIGKGDSADLITVDGWLKDNNKESDFGYLAELTKNTIPNNTVQYAKQIKRKSKARELINAAQSIADLGWNEDGDIEESISKSEKIILDLGGDEETETNDSALKKIVESFDNKDTSGLSTGFKSLDERLFRVEKTDFILIAARPGMGKTTLAMNIAEKAVLSGKPFLVFSLEMGREQLLKRSICSLGGVDFGRLRRMDLQDGDWPKLSAGVTKLKDLPLLIEDKEVTTVDRMLSKARVYKRKHPNLSGIAVDYIQLIKGDGGNKTEQITNISRDLKLMAKALEVPVFALSQLNRNVEQRPNKRPVNSDLRDSGSLESDADIIFLMYRDDYYNDNSEFPGICEVNISKFRNGEPGVERVRSRLEYCRFEDMS